MDTYFLGLFNTLITLLPALIGALTGFLGIVFGL
jgi:hypothetical protein